MRWIILYAANALVLLPLDLIFISTVGKRLFESNIPQLMLPSPRIGAALLFYAVYLIGVTYLANADNPANWQRNAVAGAILGLTAYATFELTNMALLRGWSWSVVVPDILWGTVLTGVTAALGGILASWAFARFGA